jgi:hypothetical protein
MDPVAPIDGIYNMSESTGLFIAVLIGIAFGFFLERGGLGNSYKLAMQFYLRDLTIFKAMFTAIVTGMTGLLVLKATGLMDFDLVHINSTYLWPGAIGGLIMGAGFTVGGYCPGTSVAGLATLKKDAGMYIVGMLIGLFAFGEIEPSMHSFMTSGFLGDGITLPDYLGVSAGIIGFFVVLIAVGGFIGAEKLEKRYQS